MASNNGAAFAKLDHQIDLIQALGKLPREVAPPVADALELELKKQIAAGQAPDGTPWPKRKDGGEPLQDAAKSLAVAPIGLRIFARLKGPVARHHRGRARGGIVRAILPTHGLPKHIAERIRDVIIARFRALKAGQ